jgi:hypothetical protein
MHKYHVRAFIRDRAYIYIYIYKQTHPKNMYLHVNVTSENIKYRSNIHSRSVHVRQPSRFLRSRMRGEPTRNSRGWPRERVRRRVEGRGSTTFSLGVIPYPARAPRIRFVPKLRAG